MRSSTVFLAALALCVDTVAASAFWGVNSAAFCRIRGGEATASGAKQDEELTLDEKVYRAMKKLGMSPPPPPPPGTPPPSADADCKNGVCAMPTPASTSSSSATTDKDADSMASRIASDMNVSQEMAHTALSATATGGRELDEDKARRMITTEKDMIAGIPADSPNVLALVKEGHSEFDARRALAFSENDVEDAKVILNADKKDSYEAMSARIAADLNVPNDIVTAALGATLSRDQKLNEEAARVVVEQELDMMKEYPSSDKNVQALVEEGNDVFYSRRALAFAAGDMDNARAILEADRLDDKEAEKENMDEEAAVRAQLRAEAAAKKDGKPADFKSVSVDSNFDPTKPAPPPPKPAGGGGGAASGAPPPAKKADVVFEATADQIQELVLESPVPVVLDAYADWCGPCKALTPALEEMAVKGGGAFRLVKINTDNEKAVSSALEVTALPTIFAVRDGKIINNFQGMPKSEDMMKNFMMGLLMPGATFDPPVTTSEKAKFAELSSKLVKTAGAAGFSFSARERLQTRMQQKLQELVDSHGNIADAEDSAKIVKSLLSNVIKDPYESKYRHVNLENKVIAAKVGAYPACISMLKSVGFSMQGTGVMVLGKTKKVVNVAPLTVARDCVDKWSATNRHKVAAASRKRKDEEERARLIAEVGIFGEDDDEEEEEDVDPNAVTLKVRLEGKKKVHELELQASDSLKRMVEMLPSTKSDQDLQITCVAKRLIVKSSDKKQMASSLESLGLTPAAALVVKIVDSSTAEDTPSGGSSLSSRAASKKKLKQGSHSMHSIGVYAKDDNAKGELVDGGGGVLYEQDVTDDEEEEEEEAETEYSAVVSDEYDEYVSDEEEAYDEEESEEE